MFLGDADRAGRPARADVAHGGHDQPLDDVENRRSAVAQPRHDGEGRAFVPGEQGGVEPLGVPVPAPYPDGGRCRAGLGAGGFQGTQVGFGDDVGSPDLLCGQQSLADPAVGRLVVHAEVFGGLLQRDGHASPVALPSTRGHT